MFKRIFITAAIIAGVSTLSSAQGFGDSSDSGFSDEYVLRPYTLSVGPEVGFNYSFAGDPEGMKIGAGGSAGFNAGIAANLRFGRPAGRPLGTERFGVQLELLYGRYGVSNDIENIGMNCYEIPVLFQWYFLPQLAVEFGPTFTGAFSVSPKEFEVGNKLINMDKISATDVKISVGLNCKLPSGFTAGLRYNIGTSNMSSSFETKVSTLTVSVGWLFTAIK